MEIEKIGRRTTQPYLPEVRTGDKQAEPRRAAESNANGVADKVTISQSARTLQRVRETVLNAPDVRQERVAAIKKSLAEGSYRVSNGELLDALIRPLT